MRGPGARPAAADEHGSVAAEFAIALPAVILVLAMVLGGLQLGVLQLRLQDAAADAARSLGRGDSAAAVASRLAQQIPGARWSSSRSGALVCARLVASAGGPAAMLGLTVSAASCAQAET